MLLFSHSLFLFCFVLNPLLILACVIGVSVSSVLLHYVSVVQETPGNVCWTYLGGHFGVAFSAQFIGTRRNCLHNPSVSCVVFSDTAVITVL